MAQDRRDRRCARVDQRIDRYGIGDPLEDGVLMGPLIDQGAVDTFAAAVGIASPASGRVGSA